VPAVSVTTPPRLPAPTRAAILAWYDGQGRSLPFRGSRDPYAILVSEAMAQQTQIARVAERWPRFLGRFPTIAALAVATPAEVLDEWRGLGYNRRALNLWRTARAVVEQHGGVMPSDVDSLERLPGIGPYTARAIATFAFRQPIAPVDTNVRRVLGRVVGDAALGGRELQAAADAAVPADRPDDWTHAVMDLGATVCRARRPACDACPVRAWCRTAAHGSVTQGTSARIAPARTPFTATSRWLRGRILDALRDAGPGDGWVVVRAPIGQHGAEAVERAIAGLARDGLLERDPSELRRCRLPRA
jgi:A/G-specific adenine glycosylase